MMQGPHLSSPRSEPSPAFGDDDPRQIRERSSRYWRSRLRLANALGMVLLIVWGGMWVEAFRVDRLDRGEGFWIPHLDRLAKDFVVHIGRTGKLWANGGNPYEPPEAWLAFPYPPLVPRLFTWTNFTGIRDAVAIWLIGIATLTIAASCRSWRSREELGLRAIPRSLLITLVVFSTPVVFAMERGQCDVLVLPLLAAGVASLKRGTRGLDLIAGIVFVVSAYVKYYPGLVVVGLLLLRRWYAVGSFVTAGAIIGLLDRQWLLGSKENMKIVIAMFVGDGKTQIHPCEHSLSACWRPLWEFYNLSMIAELPGKVMAPLLILPMVLFVCVKVARSCSVEPLLWPLMLWVVAAATFIPPMANDYNLFFLPLAAVAVWDWRDPPLVHGLMAYLLLWWQPFELPIPGPMILSFKLGGLLAVGLCLCFRASSQHDETLAASRGASKSNRLEHLVVSNQ